MQYDYLVIGSNSFSGSSFINFIISKKKYVIGVSRKKQKNKSFLPYKNTNEISNKQFLYFQLDINKNISKLDKLVTKYKPKFIINFAGQGMVQQSWTNSEDWYNTNILGQLRVINLLKRKKFIKKYIHFSTPEVYGSTNKKIIENFNFNPSTPYAISRASFDQHLKILNSEFNFPVIFTRAANVYGPYQDLFRIIPKTIMKIKKNSKIELHGGGNSIRSFIHIHDVSRALYKVFQSGKLGETYHISTNQIIKISDLIRLICKKLNVNYLKFIKITRDRIGKDNAYILDSKKIRSLGWKDEIKLQKGIDETINWIEKNFLYFKNHSLNYKHKK